MKRFEGESSHQKAYAKCKDKIVRKAQELTILCETDLALLMFSPSGQLTSFGSNGRVEDTFLRFLEQSDEHKGRPISNAEYLSLKLRELKKESELLEKIATIEALEEKLDKINQQKDEVREKLRFYNPDVEKISSVAEAEMHQQFLISALERIRLSKEKLCGEQTVQQDIESKEDKLVGKQIVGQDMENFEDKLLGKQIVQQYTKSNEGKLLGKQIVQQGTRSYEDKILGKQIVLQDTERDENKLLGKRILPQDNEINEDTLLGKQILQQDTGNYKDKLLGKQIVWQATSSYEDKLLGKQIVQQAASSYETAADNMKCPVSITEGSASTNKRRRGRPRKNPITAGNVQGGEHPSKTNKHVVRSLNKNIHF